MEVSVSDLCLLMLSLSLLLEQKDCAGAGSGAITVALKVGIHCEDCSHNVCRSLNTFVGECLILSLFFDEFGVEK